MKSFKGGRMLVILICFSPLRGTVIHVPDEYPTIQEALNQANFGDTVLVAPGTYDENIVWPQFNGIRLIGSGRDSTIIDGSLAGPVMTISGSYIDTLTIIEGFTIRNGWSDLFGGGIYLNTASPTIQNNLIIHNHSSRGGGIGVYADYWEPVSPHILNNEFSENQADTKGGGIFLSSGASSGVLIEANLIWRNVAEDGGGIYSKRYGCETVGNTILENRAQVGGGIWIYGASIVQHNTIEGNYAQESGGGVYTAFSTLIENIIRDNIADSTGGGIHAVGSSISKNTIVKNSGRIGGGLYARHYIVQENLIAENVADSGGGVFAENVTLERNRIIKNRANLKGGGIYAFNDTEPNRNTLAWNFAQKGAGFYTVGLIDNLFNTVVSNYGNSYWISNSYPLTQYTAIVDNGPLVFDSLSFLCLLVLDNIYFDTYQEGDYWIVNMSQEDMIVFSCFFWLTNSEEIDGRIYDDEESGGTVGEVVFGFLNDFSPSAPGEPTTVYSLEIYEDSLYSIPFSDTARIGDTLFIEITGEPRHSDLVDYALVMIASSQDTAGIVAGLVEVDTISEVFRGFATVDTLSGDLFNKIVSGQWISITSIIDPSKTDTILSTLPFVCGDANGNDLVESGDLVYLANYLFQSGPPPSPLLAGDANGDCTLDADDLTYLANFIFAGGEGPQCCTNR